MSEFVERRFRPVAEERIGLRDRHTGANVPEAIKSDEQRLQQMLKNLLSNAFKFTESAGSNCGSMWPGVSSAARRCRG